MKVVFLNPVGTLGGAERVLLMAITEIRRQDPQCRLSLVAGSDGPLLVAGQQLGAETLCLPMPPALAGLTDSGNARAGFGDLCVRAAQIAASATDYVAKLRRVLSRLRPDVIHSNGLKTHLLAAVARPGGTAVVWHIHDFVGLRLLTPWLLRWARRGVSAIAISRAVGDDIRRVLPGIKVSVIPNVIDTDIFVPGPGDGQWLDRLAGMPEGPPGIVRIGLVATYALWKGHDIFLQAAALVAPDAAVAGLRFYVIGGPVYQTKAQRSEAELRREATRLGLGDCVGFIGFQQYVAPVYRALDIVVHASTQPEPFGLTIAEAMSCGRAVVATTGGGAAEVFRPEHDALGTAPGDVQALAGALRRLLIDPSLRLRLGDNARTTALQKFDPGRFGRQLLGAYGQRSPSRK